ncbi:hypothetical protein OAQ23_00035 [Hellea sp.]|nr:hypothetical protein [Hellea sp.]
MSGHSYGVKCPACGEDSHGYSDYKIDDGKGGVYHRPWTSSTCDECGLYISDYPGGGDYYYRDIDEINEYREENEREPLDNHRLEINRKIPDGINKEEHEAIVRKSWDLFIEKGKENYVTHLRLMRDMITTEEERRCVKWYVDLNKIFMSDDVYAELSADLKVA